MALTRFPASYTNTPVEKALADLAAAPSMEALGELLAASMKGGLVLDVTGSTPESGTRLRTVHTPDGQAVLPLFTSVEEVRRAVPEEQLPQVQVTIVPGKDALALIRTAEFVAVQYNPGSAAQVIARTHIDAALDEAQH
ncbi:SseB family protein [Compostimonas suwonensis]|uniref:Type III secretion system (T3SS) SseB-like protein n=1 Tax=Compostimonas suwonensis TaxID=1048394 RepID=A0A2M9C409_9MICO|nr:SseB family protein [Compostimonas suwonensis]PJJ65261.1 type III secretion system (T3SS) SseB-like protein [Compostimonas suwonensis]